MNKHKVIAVPDYSCLVEVDREGRLLAREYAKRKDEMVLTLIAAVIILVC